MAKNDINEEDDINDKPRSFLGFFFVCLLLY